MLGNFRWNFFAIFIYFSNDIIEHSKSGGVFGVLFVDQICESNMYVRTSANGEKIKYSALTINAKAHAINCDGTAVLKKGTKVTCKAVEKKNSSTWIKIPSGWICGIAVNGRVYVK